MRKAAFALLIAFAIAFVTSSAEQAQKPAANRIKGHVMKANKGAPNDVVQRLLDEELAKA